ncbi:hypothetical protein PV327_001748 [Microctonus hyperodae]|uniref:ERAP1-like C-terminal domain-containing protein n=1 Tax=Microctonus hyperodae TaxID=165561 RepID=A0AA39FEB0_MICHY|nr:hypothetical protein PV327_001748 [Microctonus hyperodae]
MNDAWNYTQRSESLRGYIDIGETIETYANKPGYPLITITRNYNSSTIEISQERFYLSFNSTRIAASGWWIPLNLVSNSQKQSNISKFGSIWLSPEDKKISIKVNIDPMDWVICDIDKTGYYRVNYDMNNWNILIMHLDSEGFNGINRITRATLIDDAFNLARGGYVHYKIPFQLGNYLKYETEYEPWLAAVRSFNFLNQILQDLPVVRNSLQVIQVPQYYEISEYFRLVIEPIYQLLNFHGIEEDQFRVNLLRNLILTTACELKNADCLKTTTTIFRNWILNSSKGVEPNLKSIVYCEGIRTGNSEEWEEVFKRFLKVDLHIEKELLMKGLGCTTNATLINKLALELFNIK